METFPGHTDDEQHNKASENVPVEKGKVIPHEKAIFDENFISEHLKGRDIPERSALTSPRLSLGRALGCVRFIPKR